MARRSRMGSDPLSEKVSRKKKDDALSTDGVDALIRDTRDDAGASTGTSNAEKKTSAKKTLSTDAKKAPTKKNAPAKKKKAAVLSTTAQAARKAKPAPAINPGVLIDLELPHEPQEPREPQKPHMTEAGPPVDKVHVPAPQANVQNTQEPSSEAAVATDKEEKAATVPAPPSSISKDKENIPEERAPATQNKASQRALADLKEEHLQEKAAKERSPERKSAKPAKSGKSGGSTNEEEELDQFLAFRLGDESFAFEIEQVREVLTYTSVTKVPNTPDFMSGVINLRGNVVPVVDLRLLFGLGLGEMTEDTCIIVVEVVIDNETLEIGARADSVREVFDLHKDDIEPAPTLGSHLDTAFLLGMGKKDDEFLLLLDIAKVFSMENLIAS